MRPHLLLAACAFPSMLAPQSAPLNPHPGLCGTGTRLFYVGAAALGRETFDLRCAPDGSYSGSGRTQITLGAAIDLETTIDVGRDLVPARVTIKGTAGPTPVDQIIDIRGNTAKVTSAGVSQDIAITGGAAFLPNNIFYQIGYLLARYDAAKGGAQQITTFGAVTSVTLSRVGTDNVVTGVPFTRYALVIGPSTTILWTDPAGQVAAVAIAAQKFIGVLEPYAAARDALLAAAATLPGASAGPSGKAVDYDAPPGAPFTAEQVTVPVAGGKYTLAGTLLLPKTGHAPFPAVVTITGSGQQDRDEHIALAGLEAFRPFRQIAELLASAGIAVLRVDDRGFGGSTGRETMGNATTSGLAEDTRAQVAWLRARSDIDPARIVLIGHSEGGSIAPMVAANDPKVAAIVLMAGLGKSGAATSLEQMDGLAADPSVPLSTRQDMHARQEAAVKAVLAGDTIVQGQHINAWTREYFSYDPLVTIRKVRQPILILQGERDTQVEPGNATLLDQAARGAGNADVTVKRFPTLNHLFLPAKTGAVAEYGTLASQTVGDDVLVAIREWVSARVSAKR